MTARERADPKHPILCKDEVNYVGDHVAFVVAETRMQAKDAAELIEVEYEDLPAVADTAGALDAGCRRRSIPRRRATSPSTGISATRRPCRPRSPRLPRWSSSSWSTTA